MKYNLVGQKFGRLIVKEALDERTNNGNIIWRCLCDCGKSHKTPTQNLMQKSTTSCGCFREESSRARMIKQNSDIWADKRIVELKAINKELRISNEGLIAQNTNLTRKITKHNDRCEKQCLACPHWTFGQSDHNCADCINTYKIDPQETE